MRRRGLDYTAYPPITGRRTSTTALLNEKNGKVVITNNNSLNTNGVNKNVVLDRKKTVGTLLDHFYCFTRFTQNCVSWSRTECNQCLVFFFSSGMLLHPYFLTTFRSYFILYNLRPQMPSYRQYYLFSSQVDRMAMTQVKIDTELIENQ